MTVLSDADLKRTYPGSAPGPCEEWRAVPGYEGRYEVSSLGNVRSIGIGGNGKKGQLIKAAPVRRSSQTYFQVALYKDGDRRYHRIHQLVLLAFVGPCPEGYEVNHIDGAGVNNRRENLEYVTRSENLRHAYRNGLMSQRGERNPAAKLTRAQATEIRRRLAEITMGKTVAYETLAAEFNVSAWTISEIGMGRHWSSRCAS